MAERARYALTAAGRAALLHDGVRARIQAVLGESSGLTCSVLAERAGALRETVRRHVSAMVQAKLLRRVT